MTARRDYPELAWIAAEAATALDEIDRLRAWVEEHVGTMPPDDWEWEEEP